MARRSVIEELEYNRRGDKSAITYYDFIVPVTSHSSAGGSKFHTIKKRFHNKGHFNLATEVLKGFSPGVFNSPSFNSQCDTHSKTKTSYNKSLRYEV